MQNTRLRGYLHARCLLVLQDVAEDKIGVLSYQLVFFLANLGDLVQNVLYFCVFLRALEHIILVFVLLRGQFLCFLHSGLGLYLDNFLYNLMWVSQSISVELDRARTTGLVFEVSKPFLHQLDVGIGRGFDLAH